MHPFYFENRKAQKYFWIGLVHLIPLLLMGCSGILPANPQITQNASQSIHVITVYMQGVAEDNAVNPGVSKLLAEKSIDLPQIHGDMNWWKDLAVNQNSPSSIAATQKTFLAHGISMSENDLSGTCAESSVAMNINYLDRIYGLNPVRVEDVIWTAGEKDLISADGGISIDGQAALAQNYGYRVFGRSANAIGYEGFVLTFDDIQKYTQLGYPVNVNLRINRSGLSRNNEDAINHSLLVLKTDFIFQTVTFISSSQAGLPSTDNRAITIQQASFETFKKAWAINQSDVGLGFVIYR